MASVKRTFTLPEDVSAALDASVPNNERSKFIAMSLEEALRKQKRNKLVTFLQQVPRAQNPSGVRSEEVLRQIREERADHVHNPAQS